MAKEYIERKALLSEYDRQHTGEPGRARKLIEDAQAVDADPCFFCAYCPPSSRDGKPCCYCPATPKREDG